MRILLNALYFDVHYNLALKLVACHGAQEVTKLVTRFGPQKPIRLGSKIYRGQPMYNIHKLFAVGAV